MKNFCRFIFKILCVVIVVVSVLAIKNVCAQELTDNWNSGFDEQFSDKDDLFPALVLVPGVVLLLVVCVSVLGLLLRKHRRIGWPKCLITKRLGVTVGYFRPFVIAGNYPFGKVEMFPDRMVVSVSGCFVEKVIPFSAITKIELFKFRLNFLRIKGIRFYHNLGGAKFIVVYGFSWQAADFFKILKQQPQLNSLISAELDQEFGGK